MRKTVKRMAGLILGTVLALWLLPVTAAGQTHPRVLRLDMGVPGAAYEIYFAACLEDALMGNAAISRRPTQEECAVYLRPENLAAVAVADETGSATVSFSDAGLADGVYVVQAEHCDPFYICIPAPEGAGWCYTVEVSPGYLIGGEAEQSPEEGRMIRHIAQQPRETGDLLLLIAAGCAFLLRLFRLLWQW